MPPKLSKAQAALAAKTPNQLTDKQAYFRDRSRFHVDAGVGAANSKAVQRVCEKEWRALGDAAAKSAAGIASRLALNVLPLGDRDARKLLAAANLPVYDNRNWRGQHYLGGGGFGHAHLYLELDDHERIVRRMVVKDCWPDSVWTDISFWYGDVRDPATREPVEIAAMRLLGGREGSDVIVQYLKHEVYAQKRRYRVYMSYSGHGDMEDLRDRYRAVGPVHRIAIRAGRATGTVAQRYIPEAAIWSFFEQLSQACILMEFGSTDDGARPAGWREIVHRDFKTSNIFFGAPTGTSPYPTAVVGDFGAALITSADDELNPIFYREQGTAGFQAPEQVDRIDPRTRDPMILAKNLAWTNIWAVGCVLARTMRGKRIRLGTEDSPDYAGGDEDYQWFDEGAIGAYSQELRDLVLSCLQYDPNLRPTNEDLRASIQTYMGRDGNRLSGTLAVGDANYLAGVADGYREGVIYTELTV